MSENLPAPNFSADDEGFLACNGIAASVQPEGVLVAGDVDAVAGNLARIKELAGDAVQAAGIDNTSLTSGAAVAGGLAKTATQHGKFDRLSPESLKMLRSYKVHERPQAGHDSLRPDLYEFASARGSQVAGWIEHEGPSASDALAELGNRANAAGGAAVTTGSKATDIGIGGLGWLGRSLQNVAVRRGKNGVQGSSSPSTIECSQHNDWGLVREGHE